MATRAERTASPRPPLTRDRVVDAALSLADREGIAALTMRRLAADLGVEAMTLYHHVGSKDALLDRLLERVVAGFVPPPMEGPEWQDDLRTALTGAHAALDRHPWACPFLMDPQRLGASRLDWMEAILGRLRSAGFSPMLTHHAYHVLDSHLIGSTLWAAGYATAIAAQPDLATTVIAALEGRYPYLLEHLEQHTTPAEPDEPGTFAFGLDLILDGLAQLLRGAPAAPAAG